MMPKFPHFGSWPISAFCALLGILLATYAAASLFRQPFDGVRPMGKVFFPIPAVPQSHAATGPASRRSLDSGFASDFSKVMELQDLHFAMQAMGLLNDPHDENEQSGASLDGAFSIQSLATLVAMEGLGKGKQTADMTGGLPMADEAAILEKHVLRRQVSNEPVSPFLDTSSLGNLADLSSLRLPVSRAIRTYEAQSTPNMNAEDAATLAQVLQSEQADLSTVLKARHSNPIPSEALDVLRKVKFGFLPVSGTLAAIFESGAEGVGCIGFDNAGGTSYGKYQISSRTGTMERFLKFLDDRAPEWANRLRQTGQANTGGTGGKMPKVWREIASENPRRFELFQDEFILQASYKPALQAILEETGINIGQHSPAIKEVLWSTSVQHGPSGAANIFSRVLKTIAAKKPEDFDKACIEQIYKERRQQFGSSSTSIRKAVQTRLSQEQRLALALLEDSLG